MRSVVLLVIYLILVGKVHGQVLHGKVIDTTGHPVPFATIKVLNKPMGVIADSTGKFILPVVETDSLEISSVGFLLLKTRVSSNLVFTLSPKTSSLNDIKVITSKVVRKWKIGNGVPYLKKRFHDHGDTSDFAHAMDITYNMQELAEKILFPDNSKSYLVHTLTIPIQYWEDCAGKLVVRFFDIDSATGLPGEELFTKVILFEISDIKKKRKLVFDFSADNLMLRRSKGIYVSVGFPFRRGETHSCHLDIFVGRTGKREHPGTFAVS
jgi:hypothetical protein